MTWKDKTRPDAGEPGSVESWLVSAGRVQRTSKASANVRVTAQHSSALRVLWRVQDGWDAVVVDTARPRRVPSVCERAARTISPRTSVLQV